SGTGSMLNSGGYKYSGSQPTAGGGVSKSPVANWNTGTVEFDLLAPTNGFRGWLVFDYVDANNYKFAGMEIKQNQWVIGDFVAGNKTYRVSVTQNLLENTTYHLKIVFEGSNTVTIINSNTVKAQYTFASIGSRPLGFGTWNGTCYFDNVYAYTETFGGPGGGNPPPVPPPTFNLPPPD